jgi:excisionase family DNA binding protein
MNARVKALYDEYLKMTGENGAAASLTLADVMQSTLDAKTTAVTPASVLTVRQASERMGVSSRTIYDLCDSGRLRCQRIGTGRGTIRIRPSDLDDCANDSTGGRDSLRRLIYRP